MRERIANLIFASGMPDIVQKLVQRIIRGPRLETIQLENGRLFDCYTSEKYWWVRDGYEIEERREIEAVLTPESIMFDVGANVGLWEVLLSPRCRHIYAFEPSPINFARLSHNLAQNQIENVTAVPFAASDRSATLRFAENGTMSHVSERGIEIAAIDLDTYVSQHAAPTIVKLDVEGHGGAVLAGLRDTLCRHKPILFLEIHSAEESRACHATLDDLGYTFRRLESIDQYPYRCKVVADA